MLFAPLNLRRASVLKLLKNDLRGTAWGANLSIKLTTNLREVSVFCQYFVNLENKAVIHWNRIPRFRNTCDEIFLLDSQQYHFSFLLETRGFKLH